MKFSSNLTPVEDWITFEDHCYLIVQESKSWDHAFEYCRGLDKDEETYLIEIDSSAEHDFVKDTLLSNYAEQRFWIGATLLGACEKTFGYRRSGNSPPRNIFDDGNGHQCVAMELSGGYLEYYADNCCSGYYYVCEKSDY